MYILDNGTNKDIDHYIEDKVNSIIGGGGISLIASGVKFYPSNDIVGSDSDGSKEYKFYYDNNAMLLTSSDIPKVLCMSNDITNGIQPIDIAKPISNDIAAVNARHNTIHTTTKKMKEISVEGTYYNAEWEDGPKYVGGNGTVIVKIIPTGGSSIVHYRTLLYFTYSRTLPTIYICKSEDVDGNITWGDWHPVGHSHIGGGWYVGYIAFTGSNYNGIVPLSYDTINYYDINCTQYNVCGVTVAAPKSQGVWQNSYSVSGDGIGSTTTGNAILMYLQFTSKL